MRRFAFVVILIAASLLQACAKPAPALAPAPNPTPRPPQAAVPMPAPTPTPKVTVPPQAPQPTTAPLATPAPQVTQLPFSYYVRLATYNEAAFRNKYGDIHDAPTYPFNDFGVHFSKAFWLQTGQNIDIVLDSDLPVGILENSPDQAKVRGGLVMGLVRDYIDKPWTGGYSVNVESYSGQNTSDGWRTKVTLSADARDLPAPFALVLVNESGASSWCQYSVALQMSQESGQATSPRGKDQAYLMVLSRLQRLTKTPEAKEYLTLFLMDPATKEEYLSEISAWIVGVSPGPQGYNLITKAPWFRYQNINLFFDLHWDEPRPQWLVYDSGEIVPVNKGLLIESDIDQLNNIRMLK